MDIVSNVIRTLGFALDNVIYSLIPIVYKLFIYLSEVNLFSIESQLGALVQRVYVLLGIFMLFKVSFSLIQYLVDPNSFSDKSKGFGKLVTNALVTMVLLVSVPFIFEFAMNLQGEIVRSNAIGTLILGDSAGQIVRGAHEDENGNIRTEGLNTKTVTEMATDVQFLMFGAFFSVNPDVKLNRELTAENNYENECATSPIFGSVAMARNKECLDGLKVQFESDTNDMAAANVGLNDFFKAKGSENRRFGNFDKLLWWKIDGTYAINYLPFISAIAGLYVVFLLVSFSVDIAVRAIKLCFLQMIAPIAIVSYIDPKESISNSKLRNWIKECATTYFSLFLRLATIFLVMVLISAIASSVLASDGTVSQQINDNDNEYSIWIYLFLIIGAFMFAKQVPKMIESIFGIKMSGDLSLNPLKSPVVSGMLGGAIGAGAAGLGAFLTAKDMNKGTGRALLSAAGGVGSGMVRGVNVGAKAQGKNIVSTAASVAGRTTRNMELRANTKPLDRVEGQFRMAVGAQSKYETLENRAKMYDSVSDYAKQMKDRAKSELGKKDTEWKKAEAQKMHIEQRLRNGQMSEQAYITTMNQLNQKQDTLIAEYINNGGLTDHQTGQVIASDAELANSRMALDRIISENKLDYATDNWAAIDTSAKKAKSESDQIRSSDPYENAKAVNDMQKSGMMQSVLKHK